MPDHFSIWNHMMHSIFRPLNYCSIHTKKEFRFFLSKRNDKTLAQIKLNWVELNWPCKYIGEAIMDKAFFKLLQIEHSLPNAHHNWADNAMDMCCIDFACVPMSNDYILMLAYIFSDVVCKSPFICSNVGLGLDFCLHHNWPMFQRPNPQGSSKEDALVQSLQPWFLLRPWSFHAVTVHWADGDDWEGAATSYKVHPRLALHVRGDLPRALN